MLLTQLTLIGLLLAWVFAPVLGRFSRRSVAADGIEQRRLGVHSSPWMPRCCGTGAGGNSSSQR